MSSHLDQSGKVGSNHWKVGMISVPGVLLAVLGKPKLGKISDTFQPLLKN